MRLLVVVFFLACAARLVAADAGGGTKCAACGIVVGLLEEKQVKSFEVSLILDLLCSGNSACKAQKKAAKSMIESQASPDDVCGKTLGLCATSCKLFGTWPLNSLPPAPPQDPKNKGRRRTSSVSEKMMHLKEISRQMEEDSESFKDDFYGMVKFLQRLFVAGPGRKSALDKAVEAASRANLDSHPCGSNFTCIKDRFLQYHLPVSDTDGDAFATVKNRGLRGSHFRGADCDDRNGDIYPGRKTPPNDHSVDHDCNGINGANASGAFEDMFCSGTERRGIIHIGDSATAHFHIPPQWLTANGWNIHNVVPNGLDELDQPACAWGTGYRNYSQCPYAPHTFEGHSIAERLRERNLCNHRDFQNIGVNGARTTAMAPLVVSAARDRTLDHPALVIYSPIGNDVCNGHPGTSHMTPPQVFHDNVLSQLQALDAKLPPTSYVQLIGMVDGRVLWNNMHNRTHPLGTRYEDVYSYLNCAGCNPCRGWLNTNETIRNETTKWAQSLNQEYVRILKEDAPGFKNIKVSYFDPDWNQFVAEYVKAGGIASDVIEPSDGFHPSQLGNELLAKVIWEHMEKNFPEALGKVNPYNDQIKAMFGDQGGF
jgi:acyloxyacyl hydrolase